jgi:mannose-1-phosphate guanylyltransferase/mannose-6-phosphate isomerase
MKTIILAGGSGTRLWPLSRKYFPKQFIPFHGQSLFQNTFSRALRLSRPEDIIVITGQAHEYLVINQLEDLGQAIPRKNLLLETKGKNTLPAITWAMRVLADDKNDSPVVVFPSDHLLGNDALELITKASGLTSEYLVTFGINPTRPHTGYGYILPGEPVGMGFRVLEFREKPDVLTAQSYIDRKGLWNSGIFLLQRDVFFEELKSCNPLMYQAFCSGPPNYLDLEPVSIDHGLLERSRRVAVVPFKGQWNDLGNLAAVCETEQEDQNGNTGDFFGIDTTDSCFIHPKNKKIGSIGLHNFIVVDTTDALLLCRKDRAEEVKHLVSILENQNDKIAEFHTQVYRPWGSYIVLEDMPFFKIKRITVKPMKRLSLQMHFHRSEHWIVVSGTAEVTLEEEVRLVHQGESTFVKAGVKHRVGNPGKIPLEIIEVSIGEYLKEDDIQRFEDMFGRGGTVDQEGKES